MTNTDDIDRYLANLDIEDEKYEELVFEADVEEIKKCDLYLVGDFFLRSD